MESDSWSRLSSSASRRLQSRYDLYLGFEELDGGDDDTSKVGMEYNCPFCGEDFDFVGFCCHVDDEHAVETKNGVCPICTAKVGMDLVGHLTMQHASYFKLQHKRRYRKNTSSSSSSSLLSLLRKDLRDGTLQSLLAGTSLAQPAATAAAPDPFLSSFISNFPLTDSTKAEKTESNTTQSGLFNKTADEKTPERAETTSLSEKDQRERTRQSEFVQGIVLSTLFDDIL